MKNHYLLVLSFLTTFAFAACSSSPDRFTGIDQTQDVSLSEVSALDDPGPGKAAYKVKEVRSNPDGAINIETFEVKGTTNVLNTTGTYSGDGEYILLNITLETPDLSTYADKIDQANEADGHVIVALKTANLGAASSSESVETKASLNSLFPGQNASYLADSGTVESATLSSDVFSGRVLAVKGRFGYLIPLTNITIN